MKAFKTVLGPMAADPRREIVWCGYIVELKNHISRILADHKLNCEIFTIVNIDMKSSGADIVKYGPGWESRQRERNKP